MPVSSPTPSQRPTLQAVARLAQVSRSTASLILNGRAVELRIPAETSHKVREAARTLGYEANYFARGLRGKGTQTIACIWDFNGPLREDNLIRAMTERALKRGYIAHFFSPHGRDDEGLRCLLEELAHRQIEGVILRSASPAFMHRSEMMRALERFRAAVVVGCDRLPQACDGVYHSSRLALGAATAHLRASGRRTLGLIGIPAQTEAIARDVWERAGGAAPVVLPPAPSGDGEAIGQVRRWLAQVMRTGPLEAVICYSDVDAFIAIAELARLGWSVPGEVAVIGFDNSPAAACFFPPLAGIAQRQEAVADAAAALLFARLEDHEQPLQSVCVEMEFLPRASANAPTLSPHAMKTKNSSGFSLLELCIAIALLAVIALLSLSAFQNTRERSNAMKCVGNLRQWGTLINLYAAEHRGYLPMNQTPRDSGGTKLFFEDLAPYGNYRYPLGDSAANRVLFRQTILACPSEEMLGKSIPFCYALNIDLDFKTQGEAARVRQQNLTNRATYVLMSDSYGTSTFYTHTRKKFETYSNCNRRHGGIPNFLYADGHVAPFMQEMQGYGDVGANTEENRLRWFANGINPLRR